MGAQALVVSMSGTAPNIYLHVDLHRNLTLHLHSQMYLSEGTGQIRCVQGAELRDHGQKPFVQLLFIIEDVFTQLVSSPRA